MIDNPPPLHSTRDLFRKWSHWVLDDDPPAGVGLAILGHQFVKTNEVSTGSFADVPEDLLAQIKHLEEIFSVDKAKLKEVTNQFVKELDKGEA